MRIFCEDGSRVASALGVACLVALSCPVQAADKAAPVPVTYPHAGISLAAPAEFKGVFVSDPFDVMRAVLTHRGKAVQAVSLSAYVVGQKETPDSFADAMAKAAQGDLAVRKFQTLKKTPIPIAGLTGSARLLRYTFRGEETTAARAFFIRRLKADALRICYVLTVEAAAGRHKTLLQVLDRVIKTIKLTAVQHPAALPVKLAAEQVRNDKLGFSIRPPLGWYVQAGDVGLSMGRIDYLAGGTSSPAVTIAAANVAPGSTARGCADKALRPYRAAAAQPALSVQVISHSKCPAKMGGLEAWQFVIRVTRKSRATTRPSGAKTPPGEMTQLEALRVICTPGDKNTPPRSYAVILVCSTADAKTVAGIMDSVAGGFELLPKPYAKTGK